MINLRLGEIAALVGGSIAGDRSITVTGPAVLDGRQAEPGGLFVAFEGDRVDGHDFAAQAGRAGAVAVLGSKPTALPTVVVDDARAALQTLARDVVSRLRDDLTVIGLTGSQGKTSTKDLLAAVLSSVAPTVATVGSRNNELGVPITMLRADRSTRYLILEMGARHVGDIRDLAELAPPDVGIVLNVGQAHIGEFGSRDAIAQAKGELVQGIVPGGTAVLCADDHRVAGMRSLTVGPMLTFGHGEDADVGVVDLALDDCGRAAFTLRTERETAAVTLPVVGGHQALNAAAAAAAGLAVGVPLKVSAAALTTAKLSKSRLELITLSNGVILIDDSYNANPDSTRAALDTLASMTAGRRIAVLGEMLDLGGSGAAEHRAVGAYAVAHADVVVAVGDGARPLAVDDHVVILDSSDQAIDWLQANLIAGDVVLIKASRGVHPTSRAVRLEEVAAELAASISPAYRNSRTS